MHYFSKHHFNLIRSRLFKLLLCDGFLIFIIHSHAPMQPPKLHKICWENSCNGLHFLVIHAVTNDIKSYWPIIQKPMIHYIMKKCGIIMYQFPIRKIYPTTSPQLVLIIWCNIYLTTNKTTCCQASTNNHHMGVFIFHRLMETAFKFELLIT